VIVVGCPRSGTTMLSMMLHAHSRLTMPPENRFVLPTFERADRWGDLTERRARRRLARSIAGRRGRHFTDLGLDRDEVVRAVVAAGPTVGSAIGTVLRMYAARHGKARWGDKRPTYFKSVPALLAMFPDAQFVHLLRDGRDCAASLKKVAWFRRGVPQAAALWVQSVQYGERWARELPPDTYHLIRYEDLVADPRAELERLCEFLGEDFEEAMLEPHRVADQGVPERKTWHANTRAAVTVGSVGRYRATLTPAEIRLFDLVARRPLRRHGYQVPTVPRPPDPRDVLRYAKSVASRRKNERRRAQLHRRILANHDVTDRG
jgi:hypothetical protein